MTALTSKPANPSARSKPRLRHRLSLAVASILVGLLLAELSCQAVALVLFHQWESLKKQARHIYRMSDDSILGYELARDYEMRREDGIRLQTNHDGIRDVLNGPFPQRHMIAILGDSVALGWPLSQDQTISYYLQNMRDPQMASVKILNCGVGGYALREMPESFRRVQAVYKLETAIYLLNPNDFALRDTVYEGADNGLYRMYHHPWLKLPWFVRKAVYRWKKGSAWSSPEFITWLYRGTKDRNLPYLLDMSRYANEQNVKFGVVLLPLGSGYRRGSYAIDAERREIGAYLQSHGIAFSDPVDVFAPAPSKYFDETDHLTPKGSRKMAEVMAAFLERLEPPAPASAGVGL